MLVNIKGRIVIICGPASTGKTALGLRLVNEFPYDLGEIYPYTCMSEKEFTDERSKQQEDIKKAVNKYKFVVIDCNGFEIEPLYELIINIRLFYNGAIDLIKMNLSEMLHFFYWERNNNKNKITEEQIRSQRSDFFREIIQNKITMKNITEIEIKNPRRLKIMFDVEF